MTLAYLRNELKSRRVRKTMAIYVSSALSAVAVLKLFMEVYDVPAVFLTVLVAILTVGIGNAFLFAWYHGVEGPQKFSRKELGLHALLVVVAVVVSYRMAGTPRVSLGALRMKAVAVLPFTNMSDSKEDEYFSDGITEDILTQLSKISDLQVISRSSAMKYKRTEKSLREIAEELGVGSILEGTIRRAGSRIRITGQLIDAVRDKQIWAETYDREMADIFAIQSEVAQRIAGALSARLSALELQQIEKKPTKNIDAYAYYLRGRDYFHLYTRDDNERAIELFRKALAIDPSYALAYAGLGDAYERRTYYDFPREWVDSAVTASREAIAIDPDLAEGYKALGSALQTKGDVRGALELYRKAVSLNPNYAAAINNIGFVAWSLGSYDEAAKWMRKATLLEPNVARWTANVGFYYLHLGLDSLAESWLRRAVDLQPDYVFPYVWLAYRHAYSGEFDSAKAYVGRALSLGPDEFLALVAGGDVAMLGGAWGEAQAYYERSVSIGGRTGDSGFKLAYVLHRAGREAEADAIAGENLSAYGVHPDRYPEGSQVPYYVAALNAWRGDSTAANQWLEKAISLGYRDYRWISVDPQLEQIRNTSRYRGITGSLRDTWTEMRENALRQALQE